MSVLDLQRRSQQIGRIRIGQQVKTGTTDRQGREKTRPVRLDTFRFTTGSRDVAEAIATLFGGTVGPWENRGRTEWEVITGVSEIGVTVPPREAVVSQWYEMWNAGGCVRRCDSQTEQRTDKPCLCPHAEDPTDADEVARKAIERAELAKRNPPKACHLVTRVSVMIPDLPGLGVFRLDTGSFYAAGEIIDQARLMEMARTAGVFLPARLRIEQRMTISDGQTKKYPVPVLDVLTTARAIVTGELASAGMSAQLPPAPGERLAIANSAPATPPAPATERKGQQGAGTAEPSPAAHPPVSEMTAQQIADVAAGAKTRARLRPLFVQARDRQLAGDLVCTDREHDAWEELKVYLDHRWAELPEGQDQAAAQGGRRRQGAPRQSEPAAPQHGDSPFDPGEWPEGAG